MDPYTLTELKAIRLMCIVLLILGGYFFFFILDYGMNTKNFTHGKIALVLQNIQTALIRRVLDHVFHLLNDHFKI